jgi:hypothetical protein
MDPPDVSPRDLPAALWCEKLAVSFVPPVAQVDHRDLCSPVSVGKQSVDNILAAAQPNVDVLAGLLFPLNNRVEPKLHEIRRACILFAAQEDDIGIAARFVEALTGR